MKNTSKLRMIAQIKVISIAAIMLSMIACSGLHEDSLSGNGNVIVDPAVDKVGDLVSGNNVNVYENDSQGINKDQQAKFTIANLGGKTGTVGLTVACESWNWTAENFTFILDDQVEVYLGVQNGNYHIMLWFEKENSYYVYTAGQNITGINDAQIYEITDCNTIDFDQFKIISLPFHELIITGFEYWFNNMQVWGNIFDGDDIIGQIFGIIANGTLKSPIRKFFNVRTEQGPYKLRLQIWQGNYVYEFSNFTPAISSVDGFTSVHISEFASNYHNVTVTGLKDLAGWEMSATVYNDADEKLNTQMGFGIISGNTGTFTLAGNFVWTDCSPKNESAPLRLVLNLKGNLRMYELSDFNPVGVSTAVDISQFKRNYHQLNIAGLDDLLTSGLLNSRRVLLSVYDANGNQAAQQSYFLQLENNIFSYILLGDFGWTEGLVSPHPFKLRLELIDKELSESVYELSDFIPLGNFTNLDINQFNKIP